MLHVVRKSFVEIGLLEPSLIHVAVRMIGPQVSLVVEVVLWIDSISPGTVSL